MSDTLPFERLLWSGRPWQPALRASGERYVLTDFRLIRITRAYVDEIAFDDVREIHVATSAFDRIARTSTVTIERARVDAPVVLASIRRGAQLAAVVELLAGDPQAPRDPAAVRAALRWEPRPPAFDLRGALSGLLALLIAIGAVAIGLHGHTAAVTFTDDDTIAPRGEKRSEADIIRFMEDDVMPWARETLGRLKGGPERVTCATCHGPHADEQRWQMPAVAALPQPDVRDRGWEIYTSTMDAQMRNAIYGYLAESDNQAKAAYMREVVVPGMARLLHRPAYDFTRSYEYNRSRRALGCYHCHKVK